MSSTRWLTTLFGLWVALAMLSLPVHAQVIQLGGVGFEGVVLIGEDLGDQAGRNVAGAGDFNGDGRADVVVGAGRAESFRFLSSSADAGQAYVIFGGATGTIDLGALTVDQGMVISGGVPDGNLGASVSGAGDVNGDGYDDVIIGSKASADGREDTGVSYVIFGSASPTDVDLFTSGPVGSSFDGFRILGEAAFDNAGWNVSGIGDVNGDGLADVVVGAYRVDLVDEFDNSGKAYVVFGKSSTQDVELSSLGSQGFEMSTDSVTGLGIRVGGAGDFNGDGLGDLVLGTQEGDVGFLVFGKADSSSIDLATLNGAQGIRLSGPPDIDFPDGISGVGDVNGDGYADIAVGAADADPGGRSNAGEAYVVFGGPAPTNVTVSNLGSRGYVISGAEQGDSLASSNLAAAGDVNGDGFADVVLGAHSAGVDGEAYLVHGAANPVAVDVGVDAALTMLGVLGDNHGWEVSGVGDFNDDGRDDVIIGHAASSNEGTSYVVFGRESRAPTAVYRGFARNGDAPELALGDNGDGSNASFPNSRAWIDFSAGVDLSSPASPVTVVLNQSTGSFPNSAVPWSWEIATSRSIPTAQVRFRYYESDLTVPEVQLGVFYSPNGNAPFEALPSVVDPATNTISATTLSMGVFYIGKAAMSGVIFIDGFEAP